MSAWARCICAPPTAVPCATSLHPRPGRCCCGASTILTTRGCRPRGEGAARGLRARFGARLSAAPALPHSIPHTPDLRRLAFELLVVLARRDLDLRAGARDQAEHEGHGGGRATKRDRTPERAMGSGDSSSGEAASRGRRRHRWQRACLQPVDSRHDGSAAFGAARPRTIPGRISDPAPPAPAPAAPGRRGSGRSTARRARARGRPPSRRRSRRRAACRRPSRSAAPADRSPRR